MKASKDRVKGRRGGERNWKEREVRRVKLIAPIHVQRQRQRHRKDDDAYADDNDDKRERLRYTTYYLIIMTTLNKPLPPYFSSNQIR